MQDKVTKNRRFIYDQMVQNDYDLEDFDSFSKQLDNEDARKELYDMLRSDDFNVGEYNDFANKIYAPITEPEKPFAQSRSVAPTPSEKPEEEKVQLSFTTPQRPQLKSLQVEQKEYPTIAETTQKKMAEGVAQRQQLSDMTTSVQRSLNRRGAELDEAQKANKQSYIPQGTAGSIPAFEAGRMYDPEYRDYAAAKESLQNAQAIIDAAGKEAEDKAKGHTGIGGFFKGALRGADESFGDINTWTAGLKDSSEGLALLKALEAAEEGTLTPSQQALLDAKAIELAVEQNYSSSLGRGYKAGQVTAESLPFMMEFAFNPIAGAGNTIANRFARYALNRFGKQTVTKNAGKYLAGKALSHVATDALKAGAITATTGAGRTAADALQRMQGDIYYQPNEEGKVAFWKREGGEDATTAFKKAYANTTIENFSEMLGNYFAPIGKAAGIGVSKGLSKIGLEGVNQMLRDVKANDLAQLVADFEKRAQWNGTIGEFGEEIAGGILNSIIVGDQTFDTQEGTGVFNKENLIDTYLGVALLGGGLSAAKTIDYPIYKYLSQKNIKYAQLDFDDAFGKDEEVAKINEALTSDDPRIAGEALRNIIGNDTYTQDQQMSAAILAKTVQKYKGAKLFDEKMRNDPETPVEKVEVADSYDRGRNIATPQEKNDALNDLEAQEANIRQRYSLDPDADVYEFMGGDPIAYAMNETDTELRSEILDLVNAKAVYDGMTDGINERIATTIEESDRLIDSHVNKDDNLIHAAILKGVDDNSDRKVYIISGAFARNEDGTIDTTDLAEGASMIVMDATSGKREFIDPRNLKDIAEGINPAVAKQRAAEAVTNEIATKEEAEIAGKLAFVPNDIYTIADENGVEHTATIVADTQDGNVQVIIDNAQEPMLMPKEKVQQMVDAYNIGRANAKIAEKKAQPTVAQSSSEVKPVIPTDEQGKPIYEQAPVEATWAELLSLNDGNAEEAIDTAKIMRDNAKKALDKANKSASAKGDTVEAIQQAKAERKALIDAAQAKYDYWDNVANYQASQPQKVAEPTTAEEQTPIVENASFDENINEIEQVYNEESNERSTENADVPASVSAEDGIADGDQTSIEMVQGTGTDNTLGDSGSSEEQGSNEGNVGEGVDDVPTADVSGAEEVDNGYNGQEADISDEDIEALWIKSRDELWKPDDETGQILHEKLYEAHPEEHQPADRKKVVRHLIEAAEKYKDHPIAKEVLKYVKYPKTTSMRVSPLANREEMRRKPLRARAKMWEAKVGVPVHLIETFEEVPTEDARKAILDGKVVTAWVTDGEVYLYMPYLRNRTEVDKTYIHEVVAHVGMKRLLGKEGYRQFCMRVYNEVMNEVDRKFYDAYPNVKDHAQAADEYIAHLSEDTEMESSIWQKVVRIFRDALRVLGIETALTNKDIQDLLRDSYQNLTNEEKIVDTIEEELANFRFIGEVGASNLDKAEEATTRLDNLAIAREMEAADKSAKSIKMTTGWERGADGKWRYEVDDVELKISPSQIFNGLQNGDLYLFDVVSDASFDKLIDEYPELNDVILSLETSDEYGYASWDDENHTIWVSRNAHEHPEHIRGAIIHELQHAIQRIEGFAYGTNPLAIMRDVIAEKYGDNNLTEVAQEDKDGSIAFDLYNIRNAAEDLVRDGKYKYLRNAVKFVANTYIRRGWINSRTVQYFGNIDSTEELVNYIANTVTDGTLSQWQSLPFDIRDGMAMAAEKYMRTSGEVEARNVDRRRDMSLGERRNSPAWETEDVSREDQIFIKDALGEANAQFRIAEKDVKNVILEDTKERKLPTTRKQALEVLSKMIQPFLNNDMGYSIYVSRSDAKHTMSFRNSDQIKVVGGIDEIISEAVKIGEHPVDNSEAETTKAVHIFYCPVNVNGKQYSARLVVKEYFKGNFELDQMNLYNLQLRKERVDETPIQHNTPPAVLSSTPSAYKVKDLIHNSQEKDKEIVGIRETTRFRVTPQEDARYLQLVEGGNLEEAQKMVNAVANASGYTNDESWKKAHTAPRKSEDNVNPFNTEELVPADYWTHPEWYTNIRNSADDRESYYNMVSAINKYKRLVAEGNQDDADKVTVKMYRGVDKTANKKESTFRNGDWITPSRSYAKWSAPEGRSRVIEQEVPLKNIWWDGNSINEWGYDDGENYVYKDTKNNRKLVDAVTYDDNGNVIPLSKRFSSRNADVRFRIVETAPTFYSNAERAAESVKQEKATPEQWLKMIEKNGGLKAGEDKWLGLSDWLKSSDKKTLTKQEVLDFIKENQIQIEEVVYGDIEDNPKFKELEKEYQSYYAETYDSDVAFQRMVDKYGEEFDVAFNGSGMNLYPRNEYGSEDAQKYLGVNEINSTRRQYTTDGLDNKREIALTVPTIESWNESDEIHFGDAGNGRAIAWVRFGETTDADGNRVLVIDEVQSKRHQEGREKGYAKTEANDAFEAFRDQMMDKYGIEEIGSIYDALNTEDKIEFDKLRTAANVEFRNSSDIPSAPFEKNWAELAMKRMLRYAAENGFDKIAWTTGEQQAERYDISKSVDSIKSEDNNVEETSDGTLIVKNITIYAGGSVHNLFVDANGVVRGREYDGKKLSDIVGKPLAEKLLEQGDFELEGDGLRIGGEGMKAFYDQMIPSFMNKYGKKWGVKVGEVTMPSLEENNTMHSIDVTDAMRESVMQGQPMFRISGYDRQFDALQSEYDALDKNDAKALNEWREKKTSAVRDYLTHIKDRFGMRSELIVFNGADEAQMREAYNKVVASYKAKSNANPPTYEDFKKKSLRKDIVAMYRKNGDTITFNATADDLNDKMQFAETMFHEDAHRVSYGLYTSDEFEAIWKDAKKSKDRVVRVVGRLYGDKNDVTKGKEYIAKAVGYLANKQKDSFMQFMRGEMPVDELLKKLRSNSKIAKLAVEETLNVIKDEYRVQVSRRGETRGMGGVGYGSGLQDTGVVLQGNGGTEQGGSADRDSRYRVRVLDSTLADMVGEESYNKFLDGVFRDADDSIRREMVSRAMQNGLDFRTATQEYLANLVNENVDSIFLSEVKDLYVGTLEDAGIDVGDISDNELRYALWKNNQKDDGVFSLAEDVVMRSRLGVGNYTQEADTSFRVTEREQIIANAKADGTYLKAPNGKDTNLTPDQWVTVRTDAFKKWFGDWENDPANASQIVDTNGEPKVVWHGGDFAMGDFTPNGAMHFGTFDAAVTRLNDKLYGGEVRVEQNADGEFLWEYEDFDDAGFNLRGDKSFASKEDAYREAFSKLNYLINPYFLNIRNIERTGDAVTDWADVVEASKEDGYDGIVYLNDYEDNGSDSYIAFSPNQIKSAEGNTTFDANNDDIRFRVAPSTPSTTIVKGEAKGVRESFDDMVKRASYQMKEAGYDRYQSIKEFMRMASKAHGVNLKNDDVKEIVSYENPYIALLNKSSINEKEVKAWEKKYYIPIIDAIQRIYKDGKGKIAQLQQYFGSESMDDILNNYLQGKHGLERNRDMAVRASLDKMAKETVITKREAEDMLETVNADLRNDVITPTQADARRLQINNMLTTKKYDEKMVKHQTERWDEIKDEIRKNDKLTWEQKQRALDKAAITEFGVDLAERDYSGLGEVFSDKKKKNLGQSIEAAYKAVVAFEEAFDTADLWKAIKAANDATLEKAFMSSIINRETYNNIRNMYDYYIPLRGFEADTTEDVYGYLNNEPKAFSMPVKRANGRASKAEFAIPHILQMAHSAILQGNNNLAKLTMANFAQHYPSDLVKQSNMWIEYDETSKTWVAKYPDIPKDASVEDVSRIVDDFNANMEELAKDNPKKYRKVKGKMDVPYIVPKDKVHYHQIPYKRNGVDYILTVSGSPRLAFVMNGEIDKAPSVMGEVGEKVEGITRFLSGMYTQYNPDFMVSNFFRDGSFVLSTVPVREDAKYAANYYKNYFLNNPLVMTRLFNKYEAGTLNRDNYIEAAFEDFLKHGGETGYAILRDVEETKKKVKKDIHYGLWNKAKALIDRLGIVGRGVESSARFAAYLTSREAGRTIARSVYDAKEVSVNFNRKGAGAVFNNLADQNFWGKMVGNTAGVFKITHAFFNAGVQGLAGVSKLVKHNPVKGGVWLASPFLLGVLIASLYDDDDEYYNLTETVRRQNIMIRMGDDYVSIPLAIELRALYGIGEMMVSLTRGKEDLTQKDVAYKIAEQILQAFPINVLEGNGGFDALMPTAYAMVQELMVNEDWQGIPIYREDKYTGDEYKPEWRMVNNYTDERLVAASKFLSKATGGDYGTRGGVEINPAVVQHIMEGMFGGPVSFANKVLAQYDVLVGDKEFEWRNVPFLNRLVKDGGGKAQERMLNREYRNNEERYEQIHSQEGDYQKFIKDASNSEEERAEYQRKLDELRASEEYKMLNRFHQQSLEIDKMYKAYKDQGILDEQMPTILERKEMANAPLR